MDKKQTFQLKIFVPKDSTEELDLTECTKEPGKYRVLPLDLESQFMRASFSQYVSMCLAVPKLALVVQDRVNIRQPPAWLTDMVRRVVVTDKEGTRWEFYCFLNDDLDIMTTVLSNALSRKGYGIEQEQRSDSHSAWKPRERGTFYRKAVVEQLTDLSPEELKQLLEISREFRGHFDKLLNSGRARVLSGLGYGL